MKIKTNFISNSSSTIFIIVGFIPTQEEVDKYFAVDLDDHLERYWYDTAAKQPIIGRIIQTYSDNERWEHGSVSLSFGEIKNIMDDIQLFFCNKCDGIVSSDRIKLFYGVRQ